VKIIYELESEDDQYHLKLFEIADNMYRALFKIDELMRAINKGHKEFAEEELIEKILEMTWDSRINEIE